MKLLYIFTLCCNLLNFSLEAKPDELGVTLSTTHLLRDEKNLEFSQIGFWTLYDHDPITGAEAPNFLSYIFEVNAGVFHTSKTHWISNFCFMTRYSPLKHLNKKPRIEPFLEAGIGLVYRTLKPLDQGFHLNFNPNLGIGVRWHQSHQKAIDLRLRMMHFSNAELDDLNNGSDGFQLALGFQF
jgi:hypothetical protein